jgi:hypothetical protein
MESSEDRRPITMTIGHCRKRVPCSQPCASSEKFRFAGTGAGGKCPQPPRMNNVSGAQIKMIPTITVVTCMIRSALPLDSCTPLRFSYQKYSVIKIANPAAKRLTSMW